MRPGLELRGETVVYRAQGPDHFPASKTNQIHGEQTQEETSAETEIFFIVTIHRHCIHQQVKPFVMCKVYF